VNKYSTINKGLPQGAAPSTILSILALSDWYKKLEKKGIKLLMYADDGLLYSDKNFHPFPPEGFEFAEEKSR
jgi:retron-type reverse transcriptase